MQMQLPDFRTVPKHILAALHWDEEYRTEEAMLVDAGFQLWQRGFRWLEECEALPHGTKVVDIADNYRFVRLHFGRNWAWYVAWLRVMEGHDWRKEWKALRATRNVHYREELRKPLIPRPVRSRLPMNSKVAVIIATRNRPGYVLDVLFDLNRQTLPPMEVWVVDQSPEPLVVPDMEVPVQVIHQPDQQGQWAARNSALKLAKGQYLAFLDDDVRIDQHWLANHLLIINHWQADVSTGVFVPEGKEMPSGMEFPKYASQWNANNSLMRSSVVHQLGFFDTDYDGTRWGDHAYGCHAYKSGLVIVSNPLALAQDRSAPQGGLRDNKAGSYQGYRQLGTVLVEPVSGVARYFQEFFDEQAYRRWVHSRVPWQGGRGLGLWWRLVTHWSRVLLRRPPGRKAWKASKVHQ